MRASIEAEGLHDPIIVDTEGKVIDGHARRDICIELGIDWLVGADVRIGLTDDQKRAMAISLNLARRTTAPTAKQRREYAATMLLANPASSDPSISAVVGLSHQTINRIRNQLARLGKLKPPLKTVGMDRSYAGKTSFQRHDFLNHFLKLPTFAAIDFLKCKKVETDRWPTSRSFCSLHHCDNVLYFGPTTLTFSTAFLLARRRADSFRPMTNRERRMSQRLTPRRSASIFKFVP